MPQLLTVKILDEMLLNPDWDEKSIHKILKKADSYNEEFQIISSMLVNNEIELIPSEWLPTKSHKTQPLLKT